MMDALAPFLDASVRTATPLALAALGETLCERTGIINVGLEGAIIAGCLGAVVGSAAFGAPAGVLVAAGAGLAVALLFGVIVLVARADQIITGTAITLGAYGATGVLYPLFFGPGGAALDIPTLGPLALPFLSQLPLVGAALFGQSILTYLLYAAAAGSWWFLYRTGAGLGWRAVGEHPPAATAAGINVRRVQWRGVLCSGLFGGLGGAALVMQVGTFSEQMSAGRGFIALAVVALGRWTPHGARWRRPCSLARPRRCNTASRRAGPTCRTSCSSRCPTSSPWPCSPVGSGAPARPAGWGVRQRPVVRRQHPT
ncbi:MAG: ABC transporter permease [Gemmatimonadetes bacterium]|nr:ABC transporter permease [Gemmatimonadota bacterium]